MAIAAAARTLKLLKKRWRNISSLSTNPLQVCVVGSGPAGFYTAEKILKRFVEAKVDIIDRLPTPFGLVRSGVAPDHPETKDISLGELRQLYHVVVLAYGAESDRKLGIAGEDLAGVHSAREFVWWYNGHPDSVNLPVDLKSTDTAVILGQGNVALDVARILLRPVNEMATTDISEHALAALHDSHIRRVYLVGRRGPVQAACTAKEVREILSIGGLDVKIHQADLATSQADLDEMKKSRSHKRVYELFCKAATNSSLGLASKERELQFLFFRSPAAFSPSPGGTLGGVKLEKTFLQGDSSKSQRAVGTGEFEELKCGLAFKSIGYKSLPVPDLPFDHRQGIVPNEKGRVHASIVSPGHPGESGLYVVGWLKRGPSGIIGTNLICAEETVNSITEDITRGIIPIQSTGFLGGLGLQGLLEEQRRQIVSFKEWQCIDQKEMELGSLRGKPREKIVIREEMLKLSKSNSRN